jgi:hypothetical protein
MIKRAIYATGLLMALLILTAGCAPVLQSPAPAATTTPIAQATSQPPAATQSPATPAPEAIGVTPADISLDGQGLVASWQAVLVPATPFDNMHAPGPSGLPAHIQVLFDGVSDPREREPGGPVIYIIPVDAYQQLWEENEASIVSDEMQTIEAYSNQLPDPRPVRGLPVLPMEETFGVNDFATQVRQVAGDDASQNGFRFIGRFAMDAKPLTNEELRYIYQGITADGRYLVAFFFPVRTDALPDGMEGVSDEDAAALREDGLGYLTDKAAMLDALPPGAWEPDLAKLDALITSLTLGQ